jgi:thioredoxin reductase
LSNGAVPLTPNDQARLTARGIEMDETPIAAIEGPGRTIEAIRLADGRRVAADAVFTLSRLPQASGLAERLGCRMAQGPFGPYVETDAWRQTSVPGLYAAGDMARPFQTATLAAADGLTAAIGAHHAMVLG